MKKPFLLLAALYPAGVGSYTPVQVQKLLFLIQDKVPVLSRSGFNFQAYDYGPFDKNVYVELENLQKEGLVRIYEEPGCPWRSYSLTPDGVEKGKEVFNALDQTARDTITTLSSFVRALSFSQLVSAVYKAYPEMKENSVFKD